jgi:Protein of unknown function (DUF2442)
MVPRLSAMKYIAEYRLWLQFEDGSQGEIDLQPELWGEVFEPLQDVAYFKTVKLDKELNTVCWDNGADFAPEFLYHMVTTGLRSPAV